LSAKKVCSWATLRKRLKQERAQGHSIVFTNGCFDLIHVGHLKVFESCKKKGDVLVVGLNSDQSVRRLKGSKRPILLEKDRARLLAGFAVVDFVIIFKEDTPQRLIEMVRPDVLVKGGDWSQKEIVGREVAKKVVRIPFIKGQSTSQIIQKIAQRYG